MSAVESAFLNFPKLYFSEKTLFVLFFIVTNMSTCVAYGCTNRNEKNLRKAGITYHRLMFWGFLALNFFLMLVMIAIPYVYVTVRCNHVCLRDH